MEYHSAPKLTAMLAEIGFLTLFEHYKSIEVGSFFKNPRYPVWVVCSERYGCGHEGPLPARTTLVMQPLLRAVWPGSSPHKRNTV